MRHYEPALMWHSVPVPWTVSWTEEDAEWRIDTFAGMPAISQRSAPGAGKPQFGKPHMQRQRIAINDDLCDLCGGRLKGTTKVSLSHAKMYAHGYQPGDILQVEPLLHKSCAQVSISHCPSLKRDLANGTATIRQVFRHRTQFAIMDEVFTHQITGQNVKAMGHAKVQLLHWQDRTPEWIGARVHG